MFEKFLIDLCLAILEKAITKGTQEWVKFSDFKKELRKNRAAAKKYKETVDNSNASREDRKKAEDELLG